MSFFLRVDKKYGQIIHEFLSTALLLDFELQTQRSERSLFFPLKRDLADSERQYLKALNIAFNIEKKIPLKTRTKQKDNLEEELQKILTQEEFKLIPKSFDVLGHVLIIDIPNELQDKKKQISRIYIEKIKPIKTVIQKIGPVKGDLRVREYEILEGDENLEVIYKENGCNYKLDISKVFFNPRLSTERIRIANLINLNERVLDMFAGVGPFSCLIAKKALARVTAVDLNHHAIKYLKQNVKLNKVEHLVEIIEADISDVLKNKYNYTFDKIIMNLPEKSHEFLSMASQAIKKDGGIIYFYTFSNENDLPDEIINQINIQISKSSRELKKIGTHKVRLVAPYEWQVCYELSIQ